MKYRFPLCFLALLVFSVAAQAQVQKINTIAGSGVLGFSGDGHSAVAADLYGPTFIAVDSPGNVYIVDFNNLRIRRVSAATDIITTVAGNGTSTYTGDGSYAASTGMNPSGVALDKKGNLLISDGSNSVVRKVNTTTGIITTIVGANATASYGYGGDGGAATGAKMIGNQGIATDMLGNLYIADCGNHVVRKVDTGGIITTIAGVDTAGYSGDGGAATMAKLDSPMSVAVDGRGYVYIADYRNNVIRMVDDTGVIHTVVGVYALPAGNSGDNGPATAAQINYPHGIAVDYKDNLYIADAGNNVIRMVDTFGIITTVAGNGSAGFGGDLGYVTGANFHNPYGVAVDYHGHIFIADANNNRVRETYYATEAVHNVANNITAVTANPNPFTNQITVSGMSKSDNVCVYDAAGRQVSDVAIAGADGTHTFTINGLSAGMYMLQVWNGTGSVKATLKVVKE